MPAQLVAELQGVEASITPDFTELELVPEDAATFEPIYRRAEPPQKSTVLVSSSDGKAHKVRLSIEGHDFRWQPRWTGWTLLLRKARELEGGDALDAQDEISADGRTLTALIKANETRTFSLEWRARLDEDSIAGTYGFDLVVRGASAKEPGELRKAGYLTLRHPRSRLLGQLPAVFAEAIDKLRDEEEQHPFFERFLLGFEDASRPLQKTLSRMDELFGAYTTPPEYLLWLGAWVCAQVDESWPEMRRRRLIREAVELYRWRGTRRGLSRYIEIYAGVTPEIVDQPVKGMRLSPETKMGGKDTILGDVPFHTFVVTVATPDPTQLNEQVLHDIISYEKPAHTAYSLRVVKRS